MAKKRFTDIEIWDKEWYMELTPKHKCLMKYIFDKCDASGCWKPNWKLASLHIGETVNFADLAKLPKDQYEILDNGKIFINDFIKFQYGTLSVKSPAHNPVFIAIEKNSLSNRVLGRVQSTPKEEYKEKEEEVDMEEGITTASKKNFNTNPVVSDFNGLPETYIQKTIEYVKITKDASIDKSGVIGLWEFFKVKNLTGKKFYQDEDGVYGHFLDTLKYQNFTNAAGTNKGAKLSPSKGREQANRDY